MKPCKHPQREQRIERVSMPEAVYRTRSCRRCRVEWPSEVIPSRLTRAIMAACGTPEPDDFGIAYRDKRAWSPLGLAMSISEHLR